MFWKKNTPSQPPASAAPARNPDAGGEDKAGPVLHDMRELDTDYIAVNYLAHIYTNPEIIVVAEEIEHGPHGA